MGEVEVYESVKNLFSNVRAVKLLADVNEILANFKKTRETTGEGFNIFEILKVETKELKICDLLYELLNPSGSHDKGKLFLELFVKNVLGLEIPSNEFQDSVIYREYSTFNGRRIDIVIKTSKHFIPIEVKINAKDLDAQCRDYFEEAKRHSATKMFYLTPDGREPSKISTKGMSEDDKKNIECRSFKEDILLWLNSCLNHPDVQKTPPIYEVLKQFSKIIKHNKMEEKMKIAELIISSPEDMEAGWKVVENWNDAIISLRLSIFEAVENKLREEHNLEALNDEKSICTYYRNEPYAKFPGITYLPEKINSEDLKKVRGVRFDFEKGIFYVGEFYPYGSGTGWGDDWSSSKLLDRDVNLSEPDDIVFKLCGNDKSKFNEFVDNCVSQILEYLRKIK